MEVTFHKEGRVIFRSLHFNFFVRFFVGARIRHFSNDSIVTYTFPLTRLDVITRLNTAKQKPCFGYAVIIIQKLTLFAVCRNQRLYTVQKQN